jgi:hypothetical protein
MELLHGSKKLSSAVFSFRDDKYTIRLPIIPDRKLFYSLVIIGSLISAIAYILYNGQADEETLVSGTAS